MPPDTIERQRKNLLIAVFVIAQLVFVVALIISIPHLFFEDEIKSNDYERRPGIVISGLDIAEPKLSAGDVSNLERKLLDGIRTNISDIDTIDTVATVRDESLKTHYLEEGKTFLTATIDVPDLEQSYQIFYEYYGGEIEWEPDLHEFLVISCLYDSDRIIYPDFDCKDRYGQEMYNSIVARYINQFSFDQFSAFVKDNDFSTVQINPIKENPTPEEKESYIKETKAAVESLGVPAETLQYYVLQPNDYTYMLSQ